MSKSRLKAVLEALERKSWTCSGLLAGRYITVYNIREDEDTYIYNVKVIEDGGHVETYEDMNVSVFAVANKDLTLNY